MLVPLSGWALYAFRDIQAARSPSGGFALALIIFMSSRPTAILAPRHSGTLIWTQRASVALQFISWPHPRTAAEPRVSGAATGAGVESFFPWAVPTFPASLASIGRGWFRIPWWGRCPDGCSPCKITHDTNNLLADSGAACPHIGPIVASIWWGIPFFAITNLAALQSIPKRLVRSSVDRWRRHLQAVSLRITLPLLAAQPLVAITIMQRTVWVANFADLIVVMTNGGSRRFHPDGGQLHDFHGRVSASGFLLCLEHRGGFPCSLLFIDSLARNLG